MKDFRVFCILLYIQANVLSKFMLIASYDRVVFFSFLQHMITKLFRKQINF